MWFRVSFVRLWRYAVAVSHLFAVSLFLCAARSFRFCLFAHFHFGHFTVFSRVSSGVGGGPDLGRRREGGGSRRLRSARRADVKTPQLRLARLGVSPQPLRAEVRED